MTSSYESLSHSRWDCKYHIVFIPKGRKKALYGKVRKFLGPVFHELASQRECKIVEGHMLSDHVHLNLRLILWAIPICGKILAWRKSYDYSARATVQTTKSHGYHG